jgi:hypothetical protein
MRQAKRIAVADFSFGCLNGKMLGAVRFASSSAMTEYYVLFGDLNMYKVSHLRPPAMLEHPWD